MALTYQGSTGARNTSSVTLPTHASGDIIVMSSNGGLGFTIPTMPSAGGTVPTWTSIATNANGSRLAYTVATANNHTSGTWTNAGILMAVVLRGQKTSSPIGGNALSYNNHGSGTTATAPAVTLSDSSGTSAILHFYSSYHFISVNWSTAPTGYTSRLSVNGSGDYGYRVLTKDTTTSDGAAAQTVTYAGNAFTESVEILADNASGQFFPFFT